MSGELEAVQSGRRRTSSASGASFLQGFHKRSLLLGVDLALAGKLIEGQARTFSVQPAVAGWSGTTSVIKMSA
jgi:hypothetical protein